VVSLPQPFRGKVIYTIKLGKDSSTYTDQPRDYIIISKSLINFYSQSCGRYCKFTYNTWFLLLEFEIASVLCHKNDSMRELMFNVKLSIGMIVIQI
jgi:hypothetical protein